MISPAEQDLLEVMDEGHRALDDLRGETYPANLLGAIRLASRTGRGRVRPGGGEILPRT
jgi:hypothetical protein